jgi:prolyl oligopeptidase
MKRFFSISLGVLWLSFGASSQEFIFPSTPARPVTDVLHGQKLTDNYRWLEDKKSEEVMAWTRSQHDATLGFVNRTCPAVAGLRDEIAAYIDRDVEGPIRLIADRQFFTIKKKGEPQSKLYTRIGKKDVLLFDPVSIDPSGKTAISGITYTNGGEKAAIGVQTKGDEINTYYIIDTRTGKQLFKPISGLNGFTFTKDGSHAYISVRTREMIDKQIPVKTYLHTLGTDRSKDEFLLSPSDAKNTAGIWDARYADVTFIHEGDFYSNTLKIRPLGTRQEAKVIYSSKKYKSSPDAQGSVIYFYTNHEAPNYKIMIADLNKPEFEHWRTLIPEKESVIESFVVTPQYLIVKEKKDVISRLMLYTLDGSFIRELQLPELGNVSSLSFHKESNTLFVSISTFSAPGKIYKVDAARLEGWELFYESKAGIDTKNIEGKIVFYPSKDGTKVPMFIIHRKDLTLNGNNPVYLYGYGGFNNGISPSFIGLNAAFVNRGGVYVIAGIRGGDEYGESWHRNGMLRKKQNTFDDFIAAAEYLIAENYTNTNRMAIYGGSNGGLLVGAVLMQRPDLFRAAICAVPLLDMIRYHKFLIARYWIPEYGDPEIEGDFRNLLKYSPYHNIRQGVNIPVTMITAGANDTRVDPLHAKKMVAALQNNPGQIDPIMLYMDFESGHGSGKSTQQIIDDQEFRWRFIMHYLDVK